MNPLFGRFGDTDWQKVEMGDSGIIVLRHANGNEYLKAAEIGTARERHLLREGERLKWLEGKLPTPKVLEKGVEGGWFFLRITAVQGEAACCDSFDGKRVEKVKLMAEGLKMIHSLPIAECPFDEGISAKISRARNELAMKKSGIPGREELRSKLESIAARERPEEDLVFTHGDYCEPNVLISDGKLGGYIDWGDAGIADRYIDIAMARFTLNRNGDGEYIDLFFREYGIVPDQRKINYYSDLCDVCYADELMA